MESTKTDAEEAEFRDRYSEQLRGKKQQVYDSQMGHNALEEERKQVNFRIEQSDDSKYNVLK